MLTFGYVFGRLLVWLRDKENQQPFAARLGIGQSQLSRLERGDRDITGKRVDEILLRLNLHPTVFFSMMRLLYQVTSLDNLAHERTSKEGESDAVKALRGEADAAMQELQALIMAWQKQSGLRHR